MTAIQKLTGALARDHRGSVIIEFAVLAPLIFALMLGIFQVGLGMQAQNSLRSIAAETARYAVVEYQKDQSPDNAAIRTQALSIATSQPFNLNNSVQVNVTNATNQRVNGAREITLTITYTVPTIMGLFDWASPTLTHTRPIFVLD